MYVHGKYKIRTIRKKELVKSYRPIGISWCGILLVLTVNGVHDETKAADSQENKLTIGRNHNSSSAPAYIIPRRKHQEGKGMCNGYVRMEGRF